MSPIAASNATPAAHHRPAAGDPSRAGNMRADLLALAVLIILIGVVAWNRLAFDAWLARFDLMTFFLPWYALLGERLRALDVPGWNPHLFSGAPLAGDPESGWMYFPAMLFFSLFTSATAAFKGMVVLQLSVAALSTYAFARALGMGAMASLVAATVYLTGPFLHWNTHCCLIFSQFATWIPLALLGIELALRATRWRDRIAPWFLGGLAVSQMFGGWIGEGWLYAVLLPAAYIAYRALLSPPRPNVTFREGMVLGAASEFAVIGSGMALAAAGMLPRLTVNAETNLAGGDYSQLGEGGILNPPWTWNYLLLQTLGTGDGYHFRAAAFGGAAVILSLLALLMAGRRLAVPFFAGLTLVAMILTLETTPLHLIFYLIPRFREFHDHDAWRTMALAAIGPAMLSGAAIQSLPAWRGRRQLLPFVFLPLLLLIAVDLVLRQRGETLGWSTLLAAFLTTGLVALAVATPARLRPPAFGPRTAQAIPVLILVVAFMLPTGLELAGTWLGLPREGTLWRHLNRSEQIDQALALEFSRDDPGGAGEFLQERLAQSGPFRYVGYGGFGYPGDERRYESYMGRRLEPHIQAMLVNGRPMMLGLYDIQGYNPLQLQRYVEFMTALNGAPQDYHTEFLMPSGVRSPLLDLLGVRFVLIDAELPTGREDVRALMAGRTRAFSTPEVLVYESDEPPPFAWIVHDVREVARGEALPLLTSGDVDPYMTALVEGTPPETEQPAQGSAAPTAIVTLYKPDDVIIETSSSAPGMLIVSQVYASGWRALIDGADIPILPTHHALQGIPVPTGSHTVELLYDPPPLRIGLIISDLATAAMLASFGYAGWSWWARRRDAGDRKAVALAAAPGDIDGARRPGLTLLPARRA